MSKRRRKRTAAEKAARKKRREEYETVFINGKMKRIRRPPMIEGMTVDDFILANADPIFLHQEETWEYIEVEPDPYAASPRRATMTADGRERVSFITTEANDDLVIGFAIALTDPGEVVSLILQRAPKFEFLLPPDERGVFVSHEAFPNENGELATRVLVDGPHIDIETTIRTYRVDVSAVDPDEVAAARNVLTRMARRGGFRLDLR